MTPLPPVLRYDQARDRVVDAAQRLKNLWEFDGHSYGAYEDDLMYAEDTLLDACRKLVDMADTRRGTDA